MLLYKVVACQNTIPAYTRHFEHLSVDIRLIFRIEQTDDGDEFLDLLKLEVV